ncbi:MAG: hypothetical protein WBD51_23075, partial [Burkholderiaceae bacterium]
MCTESRHVLPTRAALSTSRLRRHGLYVLPGLLGAHGPSRHLRRRLLRFTQVVLLTVFLGGLFSACSDHSSVAATNSTGLESAPLITDAGGNASSPGTGSGNAAGGNASTENVSEPSAGDGDGDNSGESNPPPDESSVSTPAGTTQFIDTFDGAPEIATPFTSMNWDITRQNRDNDQLHQMTPMQADHGQSCGAAGDTHTVTNYQDLVYQCNNHVMTATYGKSQYGGYSMIYLTPNQTLNTQADFELSFDVSTFQTNSARDWIDLWITPYDKNLQLTLDNWLPDVQGEPLISLHIRQQHEGFWTVDAIESGAISRLPGSYIARNNHVTPSKMQRTRHVLRVTGDRMQFGLPDYNVWWYDGPVPPVLRGTNAAIVQLGHHSYTPDKDCGSGGCGPNTYHWDNISLTPSTSFTMIHADRRLISSST